MRAWLAGEVPDDGLALAPAPDPDADPETTASLLVARWLAADDPGKRGGWHAILQSFGRKDNQRRGVGHICH